MDHIETTEELSRSIEDLNGDVGVNFNSEIMAEISSSKLKIDRTLPNMSHFRVSKDSIPCIPLEEQDDALVNLDVCAYDQSQFENDVMDQVDRALQKHVEQQQEVQREKKLTCINDKIKSTKQELCRLENVLSTPTTSNEQKIHLMQQRKDKLLQLYKFESKEKLLTEENATNSEDHTSENLREGTNNESLSFHDGEETQEEKLIRTGEMTPFGTIMSTIKTVPEVTDKSDGSSPFPIQFASSQPLMVDLNPKFSVRARKKMKLGSKHAFGTTVCRLVNRELNENFKSDPEMSDFDSGSDEKLSDEDYVPDEALSEDSIGLDDDSETIVESKKLPKKKSEHLIKCKLKSSPGKGLHRKIIDDGLLEAYSNRIKLYRETQLLAQHKKILQNEDGVVEPDEDDVVGLDDSFRIPSLLWNKLYRYQQTGVKWLWELHQQNCGGIVGDEMGLGKTIQVIVFLAGLKVSNNATNGDIFQGLGPVLLICPTTVMHQWVKEFHSWWPLFRVAILHESGSYIGKKELLVSNINKKNSILVTSYNGLVQHQTSLLSHDWHYVILDEGHKIRNPDAQATLVAKQFRTCHRLILSGSPVQNNLKELWSLFDFVFPGKLGTLPIFMQQFSVPIVQGGYANASQVQVQTAYKCATVLQNTIKPYLLRRLKSDVKMNINLPNKSEQVLFCKLSAEQSTLYKVYIDSSEVQSILNARLKVFIGLINLRKICNHPDLYTGGPKAFRDTDITSLPQDERYGYYKRSGKMVVVESLLRLWHQQSHKVLLFTQSKQMMEILEIFVKDQGYTYMRMDGSVSISSRQPAIAKFNADPSIFVFLLTTRVGGIGVNLTGANRIIIYDPDWNPSTDAQAKERSWRIGQNKDVTIYRLLTAGTIEEKIYHRQIFKQFVTNRVLKDPRQRRFFKSNDLYELFSYSETGKQGTETSAIFAGTGSEVKPAATKKPDSKELCKTVTEKEIKSSFSSEKIEKMKELAKKLSSQLSGTNQAIEGHSRESSSASIDTPQVPEDRKKSSPTNALEKSTRKKRLKTSKVSNQKQKKTKLSVEGKQIDFLVKKALYKSCEQDSEPSQDDYVLSKILKKSVGVHTALSHDVILDSADPDYMLVEGEANRVALEAVKALKLSRRQCARAADGIPTWTGTHGKLQQRFGIKKKTFQPTQSKQATGIEPIAGTSGISPKPTTAVSDTSLLENEVCSSSDLLKAIRERTKRFGETVCSDSSSDYESMPSSTTDKYDDLLADIRNFIAFGASDDGKASTEELLEKFKDNLPVQDTAIFKSLLNKICDFSRTTSGNGIWSLKPEFR